MYKIFSRLLMIIAAALISHMDAVAQSMHDVVYLKNGSIIRGVVTQVVPNDSVKIQTSDGNLFIFSLEEVIKITKEEIPATLSGTPDVTERYGAVSALAGYGTVDGYNLGFAIRAGGRVSRKGYIGVLFVYHVGKSQEFSYYSGFGYSSNYSISVNSLYVGPEFGIDIEASPVMIIRPYINVGYFSAIASVNGSSFSEGRLYFAPGFLFQFKLGSGVFFSLDNRYVVPAGQNTSEANAYGIFGGFGFLF